MKFKPGDKVRFLNQKGGGIVTRIISQQLVSVAIEDGFEIPTLTSELLRVDSIESSARFFEKDSPVLPDQTFTGVKPQTGQNHPTENRIYPLQISKDHTENIIYLGFCPIEQQWLIKGPLVIYLFNPTLYDVIFALNLKHTTEGWKGVYYDVLPAESAIEILTVAREELYTWQEGVVQMLFQKEVQKQLIAPAHAHFRLKMSRFVKEDSYIKPSFFDKQLLMIKLTEIVEDQKNTELGNSSLTQMGKNTQTLREDALIDRHRIRPFEAEIDLHISALKDEYGHMTKNEILKFQIEYFQRSLDSALVHQYQKMTFIHGIGNGALKDAILHLLKDYDELLVRPAPFQQYGYGAIEVLNPNPE